MQNLDSIDGGLVYDKYSVLVKEKMNDFELVRFPAFVVWHQNFKFVV